MKVNPSALFTYVSDLLAPPRQSELIVRSLTLPQMHALRPPYSDALPYHDEAVTALVWESKYHANSRALALAGTLLAEALMELREEELGTPLLVPVPMHPARRAARGHNHTELLCEQALKHLPGLYEYSPETLVRITDTAPQQKLPKQKRLKNVAGSMRASETAAGRACAVVDDVMTTGATFREAERALFAAGARAVHRVALAHS